MVGGIVSGVYIMSISHGVPPWSFSRGCLPKSRNHAKPRRQRIFKQKHGMGL